MSEPDTIYFPGKSFSKSESLAKFGPAFLKAQQDLKNPHKNAVNPFIKNRYADLGACTDAAKAALNKHKIAISQVFAPSPVNTIGVTTLLIHESGEYLGGTIYMPIVSKGGKDKETGEAELQYNAQGAGSAATYARRYGIAAICGMVADDDDDAEGAVRTQPLKLPKSHGIFGRK